MVNVLIFERVCDLVAAESGVARDRLTTETRLLHDLGIFGDDAELLILRFAKEFEVNLSGFRFDQYFYGEPNLFSWTPYWWV